MIYYFVSDFIWNFSNSDIIILIVRLVSMSSSLDNVSFIRTLLLFSSVKLSMIQE